MASNSVTGSETSSPDLALVRRVAEADETALAALYDRYAGLVYSVALRVLRDAEAAEEILQDVFYQLWRTAERFDPARGSLAGWLLVSARHRAISRLRRRNPEVSEGLREVAAILPIDLETRLAQNQLLTRVTGLFGRLPAGQREVLELAYFEGLTHTEIARRTGEPLGTVKTRLRTAVQTLRRELHP